MNKSQERVVPSSYGYWGLTAIALLTLPITGDFGASGIALALALCFNPFNELPYDKWSSTQKAVMMGHLALSALFVGAYLYTVVTN